MKDFFKDLNMCRLCLMECGGDISIHPNMNPPVSEDQQMNIPIRIMAITALEVSVADGFPQVLCRDCRCTLEKSYLFRKRSQAADRKLRKYFQTLRGSEDYSPKFERDYFRINDSDEEFKESLKFLRNESLQQNTSIHNKKELTALQKGTFDDEQRNKELSYKICQDETQVENENHHRATLQAANADMRKAIRNQELGTLLNELQLFVKSKQTTNKSSTIIGSNITTADSTGNMDNCEAFLLGSVSKEMPFTSGTEHFDSNRETMLKDYENSPDHEKYKKNKQKTTCESADQIEMTANCNETSNISKIQQNNEDHFHSPTHQDEGAEVDSDASSCMVFNIVQSVESDNMDVIDEDLKCPIAAADNYERAPHAEKLKYSSRITKIVKQQRKFTKAASDSARLESDDSYKMSKSLSSIGSKELPWHSTSDSLKTFKCNICPKVYSMEHSLQKHLESHRKSEKNGICYQCTECKIYLSCRGALSRHMLIHTGQRPHTCEHCGKAFMQREVLKRHLNTHTGIRPFQCPHCARTYSQKVNLTQHINKHHNNNQHIFEHKCHLCPKRFHHASGLSRHLAYHSGVAFQCSGCNRTFSDRSSTKRHILSIHGADNEKIVQIFATKSTDSKPN